MLRLALPTEPFWLDIGGGVRFQVRPPTTALMETARASVRRELDALRKSRDLLVSVGASVTGVPDLANKDVFDGEFAGLLARELAKHAVVAWEGVANADDTIAEATHENIAKAMSIDAVARTFMALYLLSLESLTAEGNASAPAPAGNSDAGANNVKPAHEQTAA